MNRVLIVEDNPVNLELLREMLQLSDYEIVEARDGQEALARIAEAEPDLVLLDVNMPFLDGFAVIQRIRTNPRFSRLPVMAVTGCAMQDERERMLAAGFNSYVTKPVNLQALLAEMQKLMGKEVKGGAA
jgi:CheY-like chemotaxis protein